MARPEGFEPPTYGFVVRRSIQLSYGRRVDEDIPDKPKRNNCQREVYLLYIKEWIMNII
jgi:hypothetical protein